MSIEDNNNKLIDDLRKMSYLIGFVFGGLNQVIQDTNGAQLLPVQKIILLRDMMESDINEIFYPEE